MSRRAENYQVPPQKPIAMGASTPNPGGSSAAGVVAWSTYEGAYLVWDGAFWQYCTQQLPVPFGGVMQPCTDDGAGSGGFNTLHGTRIDHAHPHGDLGGGTLHQLATTSSAGFMSPTDKQRSVTSYQRAVRPVGGGTTLALLTDTETILRGGGGSNWSIQIEPQSTIAWPAGASLMLMGSSTAPGMGTFVAGAGVTLSGLPYNPVPPGTIAVATRNAQDVWFVSWITGNLATTTAPGLLPTMDKAKLDSTLSVSAGVADAGKLVVLNAAGKLDSTLLGAITAADVDLTPAVTPPAQVASYDQVYSQFLAGRSILSVQPALESYSSANDVRPAEYYEPAAYSVRKRYWEAIANVATPSLWGFSHSVTGSFAAATLPVNLLSGGTAGTAGASCGTRNGAQNISVGSSLAQQVGFFYAVRLIPQNPSPNRFFCGAANLSTALPNADPTTNAASFGFCKDLADTGVGFYSRDNVALTKSANLVTWGQYYYDLIIWSPRRSSAFYFNYALRRSTVINTNSAWEPWVTGRVATNIPAGYFTTQIWWNNGTTAQAQYLGLIHQYLESAW